MTRRGRSSDPEPPARGDVYLVALDPARGREIRKTRPCMIISPDELNRSLSTVIAAPMTTGGHAYPFRVPCRFRRRSGFVVLDQLRTFDADRLLRREGRLAAPTVRRCMAVLREMFED